MLSSNKREKLFSVFLLFMIVALGVFMRMQSRNVMVDPYLFGTDSYRHFRQTRQIVESGDLPRIDVMRNSPTGIDNTTNTPLYPHLLARVFTVVHTFLPNLSLHQFAIFYSIFPISFAALLLYLFTNRLFGKIAALFATHIFVSAPTSIVASFVGRLDTNATIIFLFLVGIYLYYESWQTKTIWKRFVYTILSGIAISFLGLIWKGVGFSLIVIVLFNFLRLCTKGYNKIDLVHYLIWLSLILAGILSFTKIYRSHFFSRHVMLAVGIPIGFGALAFIFILIQSRTSSKFFPLFLNKVPLGLGISVLLLFVGCITLTLANGSLSWMLTLINGIFYPFGKNGIMEFVKELSPPTYFDWYEGYGLILLFAIPGLCFLTYTHPDRKLKFFLLHCLLTVIAILGIAVSRFVTLLSLPFPWIADSYILAISVTIIAANTLYQFSFTTHETTNTGKENHNFLIFAWFIPSYILTCSAIRFDLFLAPLVAMLSGYTLNKLLEKYMPKTENTLYSTLFLGILLSWQVLICGNDIFTFFISIISFSHLSLKLPESLELIITLFLTAIFFGLIIQSLLNRNRIQYSVKKACALIIVCLLSWLSITGIYRLEPTQSGFMSSILARPSPDRKTRDALNELKTTTLSSAVIAANWGFGSATNELARRTTIIDEEQEFVKIRAMANAVFCGENEVEALQFLKEHKATHILLHPMDITELTTHSFAASGRTEYIGQFSPNTHFRLSEKSDQKLEYLAYYHVSLKINTKSRQGILKKVVIPHSWENESITIDSPPSIVFREGNADKTVSIKELIIAERQWYFPEAKLSGCVWIRSEIERDVPPEFMDPAAFYISPEGREYLAVKLFFGEHSDHFKMVYESPDTYGPVPVKIWEIQYEE